MLLLALAGLALAFPKLTVGSDTVLAPPFGVAYADLMLASDGSPRLLTYSLSGGPQHVLLGTPDRWVELPTPKGRVFLGTDDLMVLLDPPQGEVRRLSLQQGAWVPSPGPTLSTASLGAVAIDADGRLSAFTYEGSDPVMVREQRDGSWDFTSIPQHRYAGGWAQDGALWWLDDDGVGGPRSLRHNMVGLQGLPKAGLDGHGAPVLVYWQPGRLTVEHAGGVARLTLPADRTPREADCVAKACTSIEHFAHPGTILPFQGGLLVPYVRTTIREERTCRPYDGPMYPCDPAGPHDRCPEAPEWSCDSAQERGDELRLAWVTGSHIEDISLSERLSWAEGEPAIWDGATDPSGSAHLLVSLRGTRQGEALHYIRLDPAPGRAPVPSSIRAAKPADSGQWRDAGSISK